MAETRDSLAQIKRALDGLVGRRVRIKANKGRRRIVVREGTLEQTYPSLFVVKLGSDQHNRRVSFTYTDVLTETVELTVIDDKEAGRLVQNAG